MAQVLQMWLLDVQRGVKNVVSSCVLRHRRRAHGRHPLVQPSRTRSTYRRSERAPAWHSTTRAANPSQWGWPCSTSGIQSHPFAHVELIVAPGETWRSDSGRPLVCSAVRHRGSPSGSRSTADSSSRPGDTSTSRARRRTECRWRRGPLSLQPCPVCRCNLSYRGEPVEPDRRCQRLDVGARRRTDHTGV